jgi:3D (Asp-Asp-Asp) domain-containing protein
MMGGVVITRRSMTALLRSGSLFSAACVVAFAAGGCEAGRRARSGGSGWTDAPAVAADPFTPSPAPAQGSGAGGPPEAVSIEEGGGVFRNTYYDFPREGAGPKDGVLYDAACNKLATVVRAFHDQVCVQGSGRLSTGETVSFAKRDCECADECPRTGQKICFDKLDPKQFPSGRGASGGPVTPLRSVAVDVSVIPLGTPLFIPEYVGIPRPDGSAHDGCFVAEDRGLKVVGKHVDIFTGDPATTTQWNKLVPSNLGVHVVIDAPDCRSP